MCMVCVNFVCNIEWINVFLNLLLVDLKFDMLKKSGCICNGIFFICGEIFVVNYMRS